MVNLYFIDDDLIKVQYFERIINIIDEHYKVYQCQNGFGVHLREAYRLYELVDEAIQDRDGFWLIDISLPGSMSVAEKLYQKYISGNEDLIKQVNQLFDIFKSNNRDDTFLACILSVILKSKNRPFAFISTARVMSYPEISEFLETVSKVNIRRYPDLPYLQDEDLMSVVKDIITFIRENKRDRPYQVLLDELFRFSLTDLHITEALNNKSLSNKLLFKPINVVFDFLKYDDLKEFNDDFFIWKKHEDPHSYLTNIIEDSLKSIVVKNASLFNLFIWAWGAFQDIGILDKQDKEKGIVMFKTALRKTVSSYKENKRNEKNKTTEEWDAFVRYHPCWALKSEEGYRETLSAFTEMFQVLCYNPETKKHNLRRVEMSRHELRFFLEIDGDRLVERLNSVHKDLVEVFNSNSFHDRHYTSRKIIKYWLLSQFSDVDGGSKEFGGKKQWGSNSNFYIQNRNNENSKGITIIFSI